MELSKKIDDTKKHITQLEKKKETIVETIQSIYNLKKNSPEIDARKAVLAKGVVLEFPHAALTLDTETHRAVYREEFNETTQQYEVRKYWY